MKWFISRTAILIILTVTLYETSANALYFMLLGYEVEMVRLWTWVFPIGVFGSLVCINQVYSKIHRMRNPLDV